jgi:hypothetical protein
MGSNTAKPINREKGKNKMAKVKAVKAEEKKNLVIQNGYVDVIKSSGVNNSINQRFIFVVGNELQNGTTHAEAMANMKAMLKDVNIRPLVLPNHVPAIPTACLIMQKMEAELENLKATEILSLAVRMLYDVKAGGVKSAIAGCKTFAELDEKILSKKESQDRDNKNKVKTDTKDLAKNITIEAIVDNLNDYLKAISLKDKKTTEPQKLNEVIGKLYTIYQNSTPAKVKA